MYKLASGQLPQREMANKYLLVVSKNHSHKTLSFDCRSVCVFTATNAKGDGFIPNCSNICNSVIYCPQVTEKNPRMCFNVHCSCSILRRCQEGIEIPVCMSKITLASLKYLIL